jgi:hypothetical protein
MEWIAHIYGKPFLATDKIAGLGFENVCND